MSGERETERILKAARFKKVYYIQRNKDKYIHKFIIYYANQKIHVL